MFLFNILKYKCCALLFPFFEVHTVLLSLYYFSYRLIDLQLENSMLLDMKLDICLSDDYSCTLEVDVFQQLPISKPLCGDLGFNIQGKHVNRFRVRVKILNHGKKLRIHGLNTLNSWFKYSEFMV